MAGNSFCLGEGRIFLTSYLCSTESDNGINDVGEPVNKCCYAIITKVISLPNTASKML